MFCSKVCWRQSGKAPERAINKKQMFEMMKIMPGDGVDTEIQAFWFSPYLGAYVEIDGKQYTLVNDFILNS